MLGRVFGQVIKALGAFVGAGGVRMEHRLAGAADVGGAQVCPDAVWREIKIIGGQAGFAGEIGQRRRPHRLHHVGKVLRRARFGGGQRLGQRGRFGLPAEGRGLVTRFEHGFDHFLEPVGQRGGGGAFGHAIKPGEMREQQAGIEADAGADFLPAIEHAFHHAVQRAIGQHLRRMIARKDQRGIPPGGKAPVTPSPQVGRLGRDADRSAGPPHLTVIGQRLKEQGAARGREIGGALGAEGGMVVGEVVPHREGGPPTPNPIRLGRGASRGRHGDRRRDAIDPGLPVHHRRLPRQADIALDRDEAAAEAD